jgi:uncharacterized membrane protein
VLGRSVWRKEDGRVLAYSQGVYDALKTIHILAAIVWLGGGIFVQIYSTRLRRANETTQLMRFAKNIERLGTSIFLPASIVVLVMGISMICYSPAWSSRSSG